MEQELVSEDAYLQNSYEAVQQQQDDVTEQEEELRLEEDYEEDIAQQILDYYGEQAYSNYTKSTRIEDVAVPALGEDYYSYLVNSGEDKKVAAAVLGNAFTESGFNHQAIHDSGTGYGLFGHRLDRRDKLKQYIKNSAKAEPLAQLDYTMKELKKDYPNTYRKMLAAPSVEEATSIFTDEFERPNKAYANKARRIGAAKKLYMQTAGINQYAFPKYKELLPLGSPYAPQFPGISDAPNAVTQYYQTTANGYSPAGIRSMDLSVGTNIDAVSTLEPTSATAKKFIGEIDDKGSAAVELLDSGLKAKREFDELVGTTASTITSGIGALLGSRENKRIQEEAIEKVNQEQYNPLRNFQYKRKQAFV